MVAGFIVCPLNCSLMCPLRLNSTGTCVNHILCDDSYDGACRTSNEFLFSRMELADNGAPALAPEFSLQ